jgi:hypothetical protein
MSKAKVSATCRYSGALKGCKSYFFVMFASLALAWAPIDTVLAYDEPTIVDLENKLVVQFCQEREWLRCFFEEPKDCELVVKRFIGACLTKLLKDRPPVSDPRQAEELGLSIINCFNSKFEQDHGTSKKTTPECRNAPAHLQ